MNFDKKIVFSFTSVSVILLCVYLYTIAPTVSLWDCGEFIACSHILGIPHPPGTPFYVLLGRIFDILFPFKEVAKRVNFLSVISTALAGGFLYLIMLKIFSRFEENRGKELPVAVNLLAVFSAIGAGFCFSIWDSAVEAEVYATSLLILLLGLWIILKWDDNRGKLGNNNLLLLLVYLLALSVGIHLLPLLLLPGTLVFILLVHWKVFKNPKLITVALLLVVIGFSTYLYLIIRAHANPGVNEVNPTTWAKLLEVIRRKQYGSEGILALFNRHTSWETNYGFIRAFMEQLKVFFKYFSWQFFPYPRANTTVLLRYVSLIGTSIYVLIGLWGIWVHFKKDKESFWLIFILFALLSVGLVFYLNHEFSPSDPNPAHQPREPRERDYFWGSSFFLFMFYVSVGLYWIWSWIKKVNARYSWGLIGFFGLIAVVPFISNINSHANRRGNWIAHDYAHNLLIGPEEYSIIFTYGDNDTFPVWFLQEVKNFRKFDPENKRGVRLGNFSLMNTNWYIRELKVAGVPIDFTSPFIGTRFASDYNREKRLGRTNKSFEDWIIDTLPNALGTSDGRIVELKDMAVKSIILSSIDKKPSFEDLIMKLDLFADKYVNNEDFNPSFNIYFSSPLPPDYREALKEHLLQEGYSYKLVKEKSDFRSNREKMWDLIQNKFAHSYYDNFSVRIESRAQVTTLINHAVSLLSFGSEIFADFFPRIYTGKMTESDKDTLLMLQSLFNKAFIYLEEEGVLLNMIVTLLEPQLISYQELKNYDEGLLFTDSFIKIKDVLRLRFLRGELYIIKARFLEDGVEKRSVLELAEKDFNKLLSNKKWKIFAYKGLVEVYTSSGEEEKLENIIDELLENQRVLMDVFMLLRRQNIPSAIEFTKRLQSRFPGERTLKEVLDSLKARESYYPK